MVFLPGFKYIYFYSYRFVCKKNINFQKIVTTIILKELIAFYIQQYTGCIKNLKIDIFDNNLIKKV